MDSHTSIDSSKALQSMAFSSQALSLPNSESGPGGDLFKWHGTQLLFLPLLISLGVPGNMLVLHVYRTRWPSCTYSLFVRVLACLDLCNCLITMPLMLIHFAVWSRPDRDPVTVRELARAPRYFAYALTFTSNVILLVIAIDRYIKICWPMKQGIKAAQAKRLCLGLALTCFILTIPAPLLTRGFLFKSRQTSAVDGFEGNASHNATDSSRLNSVLSDAHLDRHVTLNLWNDVVSQTVFSGGNVVMTTAAYVKNDASTAMAAMMEGAASSDSEGMVPMTNETQASSSTVDALRTTYLVVICLVFASGTVAIVVLYSLVWRSLKTRKRISMIEGVLARKNSMVVMERTAARSARVFSIVTAAFFLLHLPHFIVLALYVIDSSLKEDVGHVSKAFLNLAELSPFVNSVINPFIYSFTSPRFLRESRVVLSRCLCCLEQFRSVHSALWSSQRRRSELVTEEIKAQLNKKDSQTPPQESVCGKTHPEQRQLDQTQIQSSEIQSGQNHHSDPQLRQSQSNDSQHYQSQPGESQDCPSELSQLQPFQPEPEEPQPDQVQTLEAQSEPSQPGQSRSSESQSCTLEPDPPRTQSPETQPSETQCEQPQSGQLQLEPLPSGHSQTSGAQSDEQPQQ